jgi:hypothetical protein
MVPYSPEGFLYVMSSFVNYPGGIPKEEKPKVTKLRVCLGYYLLAYYGVGSPPTAIVGSRLSRVNYTL